MNLKLRRTNAQLRGTVYVATSSIHGLGVFAARKLAKDEYIGTFHGPTARRDGMYVLWVYERGGDPDPVGRSGRNMLRYLNHASPSNAAFDGFDLYALQAIAHDAEITIDYGEAK
jgi:hypothetical protein